MLQKTEKPNQADNSYDGSTSNTEECYTSSTLDTTYDVRLFEDSIYDINERTDAGDYTGVTWKEVKSRLLAVNKWWNWRNKIPDTKKKRQSCLRIINQDNLATAFPMDYDNLTPLSYACLLRTLQDPNFPYQYIVHTTSSSTPSNPKIHLFLILDKPCALDDIHDQYKINANLLVKKHGFPEGWDVAAESAYRNLIIPSKHNHTVEVYSRLNGGKYTLVYGQKTEKAKKASELEVTDIQYTNTKEVSEPGSVAWLREYVSKHVYRTYFKKALAWLTHVYELDGGVVKQPNKYRIIVKHDCPECARKNKDGKMKAFASFNVVTGDLWVSCRRERCRYGGTWQTKSREDMMAAGLAAYDILQARTVVHRLAKESVLFNVESSSSMYWYLGPRACYSRNMIEQVVAEVIGDDTIKPYDNLCAGIQGGVRLSCGYPEFGSMTRSVVQGNIIKAWLDYRDTKSISHPNLHIVSRVKHEHAAYYCEPYLIQEFGRQKFKAPSISINGVSLSDKSMGAFSSLAAEQLRDLCYFALSPKQIHSVLDKLPPIVYMVAGKTKDKRDIRMFRQRIILALARGCHVIVCVGTTTKEFQRVATQYKLDRKCRIGLEKLHAVCPSFDVLGAVDVIWNERKHLPFKQKNTHEVVV